MARAAATDFLHSMRFHVVVTNLGGNAPAGIQSLNGAEDPLGSAVSQGTAQAGFTTCTTPEVTVEAVTYKEGQFVYERKYPGNPTMGGDITMQRGVTRTDLFFYNWMTQEVEGTGEYRVDMDILHFHRDEALTGTPSKTINKTSINLDNPARIYHVKEAFPTRHKVAGDLDGTASEISIMDLDTSYEEFTVESVPAPS
jgi:phage tail-like protein